MKLETNDLLIRPFRDSDVPAIFRLSQEVSLKTWIPDQVYEDEKEAAEVIEFLRSQNEPSPKPNERPCVLAIALKNTGEVIGHVGLSPLTDGEVEVGYAIGENEQGRGYATQAVAAVSRWATEELGVPQIHGVVACENAGSGRVLEKAGFQLESEADHYYLGRVRPCRMFVFGRTTTSC